MAVHLNYLGVQSELPLNQTHPEQHDFARSAAIRAGRGVPTLSELKKWIVDLKSMD